MFAVYEEMDNGFKQLISLPIKKNEATLLMELYSSLDPNKTYGILKEVE